ncbi:MAG: tetratricopeptide repeat protein [Proteobacteria bacterium]|jgi:tetratricopeptide (TPR) repeat protein|nr:tetratricopeptide repeat protein [Pseudomonadota bacterium]|tara:strand:- start:40 stop:912 length:873 start_codon:yes stop_codon:yes gene_type:complete
MKREITLILIFNILFINSIFAYNNKNLCEEHLANGKPRDAIVAAKDLADAYDSNFCAAKAKYQLKDYKGAIESFTESEKNAELQADQMYSMLYKAIAERDSQDLKASSATLSKGLATAKLGNSKYMQIEQKFLYELGLNDMALGDYFNAIDYLAKSVVIANNDSERADSYNALATASFRSKKYSNAVEYAVKSSNMYQKTGQLNEYAEAIINLATYHAGDGHPEKALTTLKSLEKFAKVNGGKYFEARALIEQSVIYRSMNKDVESTLYLNNGQRIAREIGANDLLTAKQ